MDRIQIAELISTRLTERKNQLSYAQPIPYFVIDDLLPVELAQEVYRSFPSTSQMRLKKSLRETKYVTAQMNRCQPLLEEVIFAFHDPRIVSLVSEITGLQQIEPDRQLYAGGISVMDGGHFLNPHIDNSHDRTRERYRVLNLLYYVSPDWHPGFGGELELWPEGPRAQPVAIPCTFNRLVVMATNPISWHSVNRVRWHEPRCCISNYYFSPLSPCGEDYFHVTSFRGRPEQPWRDLVLRADIRLRMLLRKIRRNGIVENKHFYRKG